MLTLAHCSDWHVTPLEGASALDLASKRFFGWLSWMMKRSRMHKPDVLEALIADLHAQRPDHIAVTGDLTNVALPSEFARASEWLERLGTPDHVSLVPGNHDAYVKLSPRRSLDRWAAYLNWGECRAGEPCERTRAPRRSEYPVSRVVRGAALIGLSSAHPTLPFLATGSLGAAQIERLDHLLEQTAAQGLPRVLLLHHPPSDRFVSWRRKLVDCEPLRAVIARRGAELILHGHVHRGTLEHLDGPRYPVPVVGVRSASDTGEREEKRAQYHLYRIAKSGDRVQIHMHVRGWDPKQRAFRAEAERDLCS